MKKLYTLIIYTPGESGWHDRCGDYHHGKDSELEMHYFSEDEKDDLANRYGYSKFSNSDNEIKLLINGHDCNDFHESLTEQEQEEITFDFEDIESLANEYYEKLKSAKDKKEAEEKQEAIRIRAEQQKQDVEKAELARLMNKYGKQ